MAYIMYFKQQAASKYIHCYTNTHRYTNTLKALQTDILYSPLQTAYGQLALRPFTRQGQIGGLRRYKRPRRSRDSPTKLNIDKMHRVERPDLCPVLWSLHGAHGEFEVVVEMITKAGYFVTVLLMCTLSNYNFVVTLIKIS